MGDAKPTRSQGDLAEMLETLLDKGVVVNADVAVTVGDTELLGVKLRAAIASFETAAEYGLEFPSGTDMERVADAAGISPVTDAGDDDPGAGRSAGGREVPVRTPSTPAAPTVEGDGADDGSNGAGVADDGSNGAGVADDATAEDVAGDDATAGGAPASGSPPADAPAPNARRDDDA